MLEIDLDITMGTFKDAHGRTKYAIQAILETFKGMELKLSSVSNQNIMSGSYADITKNSSDKSSVDF